MLQALQAGQSVQEDDQGELALAIPLKVRDQVIGVLDFRKDTSGRSWTDEEKVLLETLAEQLGVALESARLYQDTQRRAARERLTREITDNIRAATSVEDAMQRAVQEISRVLGAEMVARIGTEQELLATERGDGHE
jgi:GAF domain-containing protein